MLNSTISVLHGVWQQPVSPSATIIDVPSNAIAWSLAGACQSLCYYQAVSNSVIIVLCGVWQQPVSPIAAL